jgi:hypothetical protein
MTNAYVETTVLTDLLLKPKTPKNETAKAALARYENTLLPVYSIKEWKAGPLANFAYLHNKLAVTHSFEATFQALSVLRAGYLKSTSMEGLKAAATVSKSRAETFSGLCSRDEEMADSYRLALASLILRSWRKRRRITTRVVDELPCYMEAEPYLDRDGLINVKPRLCEADQECCLGPQLKSKPKVLEALRNAIPQNSNRKEDQRRRRALRRLLVHPNERVDRDMCRDLGDAIFAFFCPDDTVVLTTNLRDHQPLAEAIGKRAEKP